MAHGGGGRLTQQLIAQMFLPSFDNPQLNALHDGAVLPVGGERLAFTTDSYVVQPLFFPGGDIGTLAVYGTVNDLAMCGARPLYLSAGFIIEEGLAFDVLERVVASMAEAAACVGLQLVTGDTKVVDKGKGDGLFVNTAGIGVVETELTIGPSAVRPGDRIVLSGDIGRHGVAILAARESLGFATTLSSDCAPLAEPVQALLAGGVEVHCLRDLTRGGLGAALCEIAGTSGRGLRIREGDLPVRQDVSAACELLGLDPLYVANEGKLVAIVPAADADRLLEAMRAHPLGRRAALIGEVTEDAHRFVQMRTRFGGKRIVDWLAGDQLPRIC
jgi:hydrogenase expression/formation protein HypE